MIVSDCGLCCFIRVDITINYFIQLFFQRIIDNTSRFGKSTYYSKISLIHLLFSEHLSQ